MKYVCAAALMSVLLIGCSESTTGPVPSAFSASFQVKTAAGQPVEGLRVSVWSTIVGIPPLSTLSDAEAARVPPPSTYQLYQNYPNPFNGMTTIGFDLPVEGDYVLTTLALDGRMISQRVETGLYAGHYEVGWVQMDTLCTAYWMRLEAGPAGTPDYVDSICAVSWYPVADANVIGFTDAEGTVTTRDSVRFGNLFRLPELPSTDATGPDTLSLFQFADSIHIVVVDTAAARTEAYGRRLSAGENAFELIW